MSSETTSETVPPDRGTPVRRPRGRGRPQTRPNEAAILGAGVEAFGANGFNGASMRDIAARAGTSLANLYNYVPSKGELLAAVLKQANDDLLGALTTGIPERGSAAERLEAAVLAYVGWTVRSQVAGVVALGEFRYLEGEQRSDVVRARDTTQQIFSDIVEQGVAAGEFATPHPHEAARNIVLLCAALATWFRPDGPDSPESVAAQQARLALAMVEAGGAGGEGRHGRARRHTD